MVRVEIVTEPWWLDCSINRAHREHGPVIPLEDPGPYCFGILKSAVSNWFLLSTEDRIVFFKRSTTIVPTFQSYGGGHLFFKMDNQWRSQGLPEWASRSPGRPNWGRKWRKIEEKWQKIQEWKWGKIEEMFLSCPPGSKRLATALWIITFKKYPKHIFPNSKWWKQPLK